LGKCVRWCEASVMATETNRAKKFYRFERLPTPNALNSISPNGRFASGLFPAHMAGFDHLMRAGSVLQRKHIDRRCGNTAAYLALSSWLRICRPMFAML
jgi:hypothetical protein